MTQKPHRGTEKVFRLFLCLCGILWFCGVGFAAEEAEHRPRHGGSFGDADDLYHYEVLLEAPHRLVLYVNDEFNQPLDVRTLQARWMLNPDDPVPAAGAFRAEDRGRYFFVELPAPLTPEPIHVKVEVLKDGQWVGMEFDLPSRVPFEPIEQGVDSGAQERAALAVRTQAAWQEVWERHTARVRPTPPRPRADFDREMIIAVFLGQRPTGGFAIEIKRIERSADSLHVLVEETVPDPDAMVTQAFTSPYHIVRLARTDLLVEFEFH